MRAYGYIRVSTEKQAEQGISIDAQLDKIRAMSVVQGAELIEVINDEGYSAKNLKRPGMKRLLDLVDSGEVQTIIVTKLDRLTRSVKDLGTLLERFDRRGVSLVSLSESLDTQTAVGRLMLNILMSVSQWQRENTGEVTKDIMQFKKSRGERAGIIPFGYRLAEDGIHIEQCPKEQEVLFKVKELRDLGYTLQDIADELNARGYLNRRGSNWRNQYISSLLKVA